MAIIGLILHGLFVQNIFKKSWPEVKWKNNKLIKKTHTYDKKCCTDYGCDGELQSNSYDLDINTCCITRKFGKNGISKTCTQEPCKKWLDPCSDCNISKEYSVLNKDGIYNKTIPRVKCENLNDINLDIPTKLYANPNNINETSELSKKKTLMIIGVLLFIWWIVLIINIIKYYMMYRAGKYAYNYLKK